jgi:hypothetical protein
MARTGHLREEADTLEADQPKEPPTQLCEYPTSLTNGEVGPKGVTSEETDLLFQCTPHMKNGPAY